MKGQTQREQPAGGQRGRDRGEHEFLVAESRAGDQQCPCETEEQQARDEHGLVVAAPGAHLVDLHLAELFDRGRDVG